MPSNRSGAPRPRARGDASTTRESLKREIRELRESLTVLNETRERLSALSVKFVLVNRISQELNTLDMDRIAATAVRRIAALLNARHCGFYLYDYLRNRLILKAHNLSHPIRGSSDLDPTETTLIGQALAWKRALPVPNIAEHERQMGMKLVRTPIDRDAAGGGIFAPLMAGSHAVGVLALVDKMSGGTFDEVNDLPLVEQLSHVLAMAIRNCLLFEEVQTQARTDGLTKLANYRTFYETLRTEMHRSERYGRPLTLAMLDVDAFKTVNDRFGHPAGDRVLVQLGKLLTESLRREDLAARYGGDEIALVLPETPLAGARVVADRILSRVRETLFLEDSHRLPVTLSIGLACHKKGMSPTELIESADRALYAAKQNGKNRIEVAEG